MITVLIEAVSTSEILVSIYPSTWCNIPEDQHVHGKKVGQSFTDAWPVKVIIISEVNALFCLLSITSHTTARLLGPMRWDDGLLC
jgi:hypothetical protein